MDGLAAVEAVKVATVVSKSWGFGFGGPRPDLEAWLSNGLLLVVKWDDNFAFTELEMFNDGESLGAVVDAATGLSLQTVRELREEVQAAAEAYDAEGSGDYAHDMACAPYGSAVR